MRIIITDHFLCCGWAFDAVHFHGEWVVTKGGNRFHLSQWRVAKEGEAVEKVNPDLAEVIVK